MDTKYHKQKGMHMDGAYILLLKYKLQKGSDLFLGLVMVIATL